jgi:hypothetical protein
MEKLMIERLNRIFQLPAYHGFWLAFSLFGLALPSKRVLGLLCNVVFSVAAAYDTYRLIETTMERKATR